MNILITLFRLLLCWWIVSYGLDAFNYIMYDVPISPSVAFAACIISALTFLEMLVISILRSRNNGLDGSD